MKLFQPTSHYQEKCFHCSKSIPPASCNLDVMAYSYLRNECDPVRIAYSREILSMLKIDVSGIARCGPDCYCNRLVAHHFIRSGRDLNRCRWDRFCVRTYSDAGEIAYRCGPDRSDPMGQSGIDIVL